MEKQEGNAGVNSWLLQLSPVPAEHGQKQKEDPVLQTPHQWKAEGRPDKNAASLESCEVKYDWLCWAQIEECGGVLHHLWEEDNGPLTSCLLIPKSLQENLLVHSHQVPTGRHPRVEHMMAHLRQKYYWHGM